MPHHLRNLLLLSGDRYLITSRSSVRRASAQRLQTLTLARTHLNSDNTGNSNRGSKLQTCHYNPGTLTGSTCHASIARLRIGRVAASTRRPRREGHHTDRPARTLFQLRPGHLTTLVSTSLEYTTVCLNSVRMSGTYPKPLDTLIIPLSCPFSSIVTSIPTLSFLARSVLIHHPHLPPWVTFCYYHSRSPQKASASRCYSISFRSILSQFRPYRLHNRFNSTKKYCHLSWLTITLDTGVTSCTLIT